MFLTTVTTVLGLVPLVLRLNVDLIGREITHGGPSTDWWVDLSTAVAGGLTFATLITLVLTPCLLLLGANVGAWVAARRRRTPRPEEPREAAAPADLPQAAE